MNKISNEDFLTLSEKVEAKGCVMTLGELHDCLNTLAVSVDKDVPDLIVDVEPKMVDDYFDFLSNAVIRVYNKKPFYMAKEDFQEIRNRISNKGMEIIPQELKDAIESIMGSLILENEPGMITTVREKADGYERCDQVLETMADAFMDWQKAREDLSAETHKLFKEKPSK